MQIIKVSSGKSFRAFRCLAAPTADSSASRICKSSTCLAVNYPCITYVSQSTITELVLNFRNTMILKLHQRDTCHRCSLLMLPESRCRMLPIQQSQQSEVKLTDLGKNCGSNKVSGVKFNGNTILAVPFNQLSIQNSKIKFNWKDIEDADSENAKDANAACRGC